MTTASPGADSLHRDGLALWRAGRLDDALDRLGRAVDLAPGEAALRNSFGLVLAMLDEPAAAAASFRVALALAPGDPVVWSNLGNAARLETAYLRAIVLDPAGGGARGNLAQLRHSLGHAEEAGRLYRQALALAPAFAEAWSNLGVWRQQDGEIAFAERALPRAVAADPGFADGWWNRGILRLLRGDYTHGLADYEWRWRRRGIVRPAFAMPSWRGEDPNGRRILVWSEQGHGDTIQFLRFAPLLARLGAEVVLAVPGRLRRLIAGAARAGRVVAIEEPLPEADLEAALMSLPFLLGLEDPAAACSPPYLAAPTPVRLERDRRPVVGVVWAGSPVNEDDARRSLSLERLRPALDVAGLRWISLQFGPRSSDIAACGLQDRIDDPGERLGDFATTAGLVAALDLVVTVDTAMAHLAGALAKEAWVLLARVPDWRWGLAGETTPWYPSLRLFRQERPGDWDGVVAGLAGALGRWRDRPSAS